MAKAKENTIAKTDSVNAKKQRDVARGIVLYTDGGTHGKNPGPCGSGIHGYTYTFEKTSKGIGVPKVTPTNRGYQEKTEDILDPGTVEDVFALSLDKKPYSVTVDKFINITYSHGYSSSNNQAEATALLVGLELVNEYCHSHPNAQAMIYSDSTYAVNGYNRDVDDWANANYVKEDGSSRPNESTWREIKKIRDEIVSNGHILTVEWTKGHDGNIGNETADKLATMAASGSVSNEPVGDHQQYVKDNTVIADADFFFNKAQIHPFLSEKRFYFNPSHPASIGRYYLGELGNQVPDIHIGKEISDAALAVVELKENDPVLETIKACQLNWLKKHNYNEDCLVAGMLDKASIRSKYNDFLLFKEKLIKVPDRVRPDLFLVDLGKDKNVQLTMVLDPPYLSMRTLDQFTILENRAESVLKGLFKGEVIDITEHFFDIKDDTYTLKSHLTSTVKSITVDTPKTKVVLTLGIDCLSRDSFKQCERYQPKVELLLWKEDETLYGYATMVRLNTGEWGIWMASYSGHVLN